MYQYEVYVTREHSDDRNVKCVFPNRFASKDEAIHGGEEKKKELEKIFRTLRDYDENVNLIEVRVVQC